MYWQSERNLLNSNISSRCPHNMANFGPQMAEISWQVWAPQQFQPVSHLGFVTAVTLFTGGQPNFAWCLAISWAGTLYIHFSGAFAPWWNFGEVQTSLCVQVLRSPILAALLHGTRVVGVSQTLHHWAECATYIWQGGHHVGHFPHSSMYGYGRFVSGASCGCIRWQSRVRSNVDSLQTVVESSLKAHA